MNNLVKIALRYILISTCMLCFLTATAFAQTPVKITVLDFKSSKAESAHATVVREMFEIELFKQKKFQILERNQITLILKEQGFQMSGCTDTSCAVQIGKLLSADIVVFGNVNKVDGYTISAKFVHVANGTIIAGDYDKATDEKKIIQSVKLLVSRLTQQAIKAGKNDRNQANSNTDATGSSKNSFFVNLGIVSHYNSDYRATHPQLSIYNKSLALGIYTQDQQFSPGIQTGYINSGNETNFYNDTPIAKNFWLFPVLLSFRYNFILNITNTTSFNIMPVFSIGGAYTHYTEKPVNNLTLGLPEKDEYFITLFIKPGILWGLTFQKSLKIFMGIDYATNLIIDKDIRLFLVNAGVEYSF